MSQQGGINTGVTLLSETNDHLHGGVKSRLHETQCLVLYSDKKRLMLVVAILMAQNWTVQAIQ